MKQQTTAHLNYLRVAPRKVRALVDLIRGMRAEEALLQLTFTKKHAALPLKKLLASAIANAEHNHDMAKESLVIIAGHVNGGPVAKRYQPRAFGRASVIRKRTAHVTLTLEGDVAAGSRKRKENKTEAAEHAGHDHTHDDETAVRSSDTPKTKKHVSGRQSVRKPTAQKRSTRIASVQKRGNA